MLTSSCQPGAQVGGEYALPWGHSSHYPPVLALHKTLHNKRACQKMEFVNIYCASVPEILQPGACPRNPCARWQAWGAPIEPFLNRVSDKKGCPPLLLPSSMEPEVWESPFEASQHRLACRCAGLGVFHGGGVHAHCSLLEEINIRRQCTVVNSETLFSQTGVCSGTDIPLKNKCTCLPVVPFSLHPLFWGCCIQGSPRPEHHKCLYQPHPVPG